MEVVSPLSFARANQSGKRRFACSPIHDATTTNVANVIDSSGDFDMDDCSGYGYQATKRRRKLSNNDGVDSLPLLQSTDKWSLSTFVPSSSFSVRRSPNSAGVPSKRSRSSQFDSGVASSASSHQKLEELQNVVEQQATEIEQLKADKEASQASFSELSSQHEKAGNENRILKRAVTIQQERQHQMNSELEGARRFKVEAEERIRRLEHMNLTLQYQLQALNSSAGNDFMRFGPQPPDVY